MPFMTVIKCQNLWQYRYQINGLDLSISVIKTIFENFTRVMRKIENKLGLSRAELSQAGVKLGNF